MRPIVSILIYLIPVLVCARETGFVVDTNRIRSTILNEDRSLILFIPQNLRETDSVTFLYLLDGEYANYRYQNLYSRFGDTISQVIAVGIVNTDRRRDLLYANSADRFLDFITDELIPATEKNFNAKARILYGHSFGGGFTVYAMINKPDYFSAYIASSPTPILDLVKKEYYLHIDSAGKNKIRFYFSMGSGDMAQVSKWALKLRDILSTLTFNNLNWHFTIFEGKDHNNSDVSALKSGFHDFRK